MQSRRSLVVDAATAVAAGVGYLLLLIALCHWLGCGEGEVRNMVTL